MPNGRRINIDAIDFRPRSLEQVSVKASGGSTRIPVRQGGWRSGGQKKVPAEYSRLNRPTRRGGGFLVFLFILLLAAAAGFYYWNNYYPRSSGDSVKLKVTATESIISGDEVTYALEYVNQDVVALRTVELDVQWPDGFYYDSSTQNPTSETATTWSLGPLDPGQMKTLEIKGQLVGLKDQQQTAIFRLSYRPENISSDFEVTQSVTVVISQSKIDLKLEAPPKVLAGGQIELAAEIRNVTDQDLTDIDIEIIFPKDVALVSSDPGLTDNHWRGILPAGGAQSIKIQGKAADDGEGSQPWVMEIGQKSGEDVRRLLRQELPLEVIKPNFSFELKVNGQSGNMETEFGKTLNYQLKLTNASQQALSGIKVSALLDSDILDRATLKTNGQSNGDSIVWTPAEVQELASLAPSGEVIIPWSINLLPSSPAGRATVDTVIALELEGLPGWQQTSPVYIVTAGQGLVFNQGLYWELGGQKVGKGNLPPVTNESTQYLVIWSLEAGSLDFDSVNASVFLGPKVSFIADDSVDEGSLQYDPATNRLAWQIDNFSSKLLPLQASFYVKLIPTDEDAGTVMTVMNPVSIVASGIQDFQAKSFSLKTSDVIAVETGDWGRVVE